tara:strand:+ start:291 stop:1442 length:1152 start_codon:yes stop_codon:yes gene_type:complete
MNKLNKNNYKEAVNSLHLNKSFTKKELVQLCKENELRSSAPKKIILAERLFNFLTDPNSKFRPDLPKKVSLIDLLQKNLEYYTDNDFRYTLHSYKLKTTGNTKILILRLRNFAKRILFYFKNKNIVIKIQKFYKKYLYNKLISLKGNSYKNRELCVNKEDFYTFSELSSIPNIYFLMFKDSDKFIYGFDIRSLLKFIKNLKRYKKPYNPYNNKPFSKDILNKINKIERLLKIMNYNTCYPEVKFCDLSLEIEDKAKRIFHKFNMLKYYTKADWFLKLSIGRLKKLYELAEDIWNFRLEISKSRIIRRKYIPKENAFVRKPSQIYSMKDKHQIQHIILDEFNRFVTDGITVEERKMGAMWMLRALVDVSPEAANALPYLVQVDE